jgi:hypothetical protein
MEGSVLSFLKAEWKVSDTGSVQCWASSYCIHGNTIFPQTTIIGIHEIYYVYNLLIVIHNLAVPFIVHLYFPNFVVYFYRWKALYMSYRGL